MGSIGNSGNGFRRRPKQQRNTRKTAMLHDNKQYKPQQPAEL
ncbi:MAG: hypothetical protein Q7R76_00945 [Candidatus Woesearchaeota archaeon]|nr:hypothetical protein [Candidatus Woesearchaeota archaeon]